MYFLGLARRIWLSRWPSSLSAWLLTRIRRCTSTVRVGTWILGISFFLLWPPLQVWPVKVLTWVAGGLGARRHLVVFHAVSHCNCIPAALAEQGVLGAEQSWVLEWSCAWGSCLQINLLWLERVAVLDQASRDRQGTVPKCKRSYLHVFTRTVSSWESPAPRYYHGHAVSCCLPGTCGSPSLQQLHNLSCLISISLARASTPLSHFPGAQQYSQAGSGLWKCLTGWSGLGPCWMLYLPILLSIPALGDVLCRWAEGFCSQFFSVWLVKSISAVEISSLSSYRLVGWMFALVY